jgi:hypothetical protein
MTDAVTNSVLAGLRSASGTGVSRAVRDQRTAPYARIVAQGERDEREKLAASAERLLVQSRTLRRKASREADEREAARLYARSGALFAASRGASDKLAARKRAAGV